MSKSPQLDTEGPVQLTLNCGGADQSGLAIIAVTVRHALGALPWARITLSDGDLANNEWPLSDGPLFAPGAEIIIKAGYGDDQTPIFTGIVVRHGLKIDGNNDCRLVVECCDKACKMPLTRHSANYVDQTDSAILHDLITRAGLQADVPTPTITHKALTQYDCSDWDFLLARADALGLLVNVQAGKVSVKAPDVSAEPVLTVTYGADLFELSADMDARSQWRAAPPAPNSLPPARPASRVQWS
jgi:phage protein D